MNIWKFIVHILLKPGLENFEHYFSSVWRNWAPKNWCFWTVVLEKTLEGSLDYKEMQQVHPKGDQSWVFISRTDVEAETPILWPPMWRADSFEKTLMLEKIEGRRRRGWQRMRRLDGIINSMDWVWVNSGSWWWTRRPDVLQVLGLQRVGQDWATELNWTDETLQDLLEWIPPKDLLFIIGDWNAKVGSQVSPGVTGEFSLGNGSL